MYGSSLRIETRRPRALRSRPMLAAVIPFPREEVTPPVTKTYFATEQTSGGFSNAIENRVPGQGRIGRQGSPTRRDPDRPEAHITVAEEGDPAVAEIHGSDAQVGRGD